MSNHVRTNPDTSTHCKQLRKHFGCSTASRPVITQGPNPAADPQPEAGKAPTLPEPQHHQPALLCCAGPFLPSSSVVQWNSGKHRTRSTQLDSCIPHCQLGTSLSTRGTSCSDSGYLPPPAAIRFNSSAQRTSFPKYLQFCTVTPQHFNLSFLIQTNSTISLLHRFFLTNQTLGYCQMRRLGPPGMRISSRRRSRDSHLLKALRGREFI